MNKKLLVTGSIFGLMGVLIGAFGAHGLKESINTEALVTFETGVKYQMYHAFLLMLISVFALSEKIKRTLLILIITGTLFFSGSIYGLATNALTGFDFTKIALLTPLGGTLLIIAWGVLVVKFFQLKTQK